VLKDDFAPLAVKVSLIRAIAVIMETTTAAMPFWEFVLAELEGFAALPLTESSDRAEAAALMEALAEGYRALIIAAKDDPLIERIFQRFKKIVDFIGRILDLGFCNAQVAEAVTDMLASVLKCPRQLQKKVNAYLHREVIRKLLSTARMEFNIIKAHEVEQYLLNL
jgi:hypothetical protein